MCFYFWGQGSRRVSFRFFFLFCRCGRLRRTSMHIHIFIIECVCLVCVWLFWCFAFVCCACDLCFVENIFIILDLLNLLIFFIFIGISLILYHSHHNSRAFIRKYYFCFFSRSASVAGCGEIYAYTYIYNAWFTDFIGIFSILTLVIPFFSAGVAGCGEHLYNTYIYYSWFCVCECFAVLLFCVVFIFVVCVVCVWPVDCLTDCIGVLFIFGISLISYNLHHNSRVHQRNWRVSLLFFSSVASPENIYADPHIYIYMYFFIYVFIYIHIYIHTYTQNSLMYWLYWFFWCVSFFFFRCLGVAGCREHLRRPRGRRGRGGRGRGWSRVKWEETVGLTRRWRVLGG